MPKIEVGLSDFEKVSQVRTISNLRIMVRLMKIVKPLWGTMAKCILSGIMGHLVAIFMMTFASMLFVNILSKPTPHLSLDRLLLIILTLACGFSRGVFNYLEHLNGHDVAFRSLALIRKKTFDALVNLAPAKMTEKRSGDLVQTITSDTEYVEPFIAHTIAPITIGIVVPSIILIFVGQYWSGFSLILLVFYFILGGAIPLIIPKLGKNYGRSYRKALAGINTHLLDSLQGLKELILFGRGKDRLSEVQAKGKDVTKNMGKLKMRGTYAFGFAESLIILCIVMIVLLGLSVGVPPGSLIIVSVTAASSFSPVIALSTLGHTLQNTFAASERIFNILDEAPAVSDKSNALERDITNPGVINYKNVEFIYPGSNNSILKYLTQEIKPNSKIAFVGQSGCGKTTLLRLLLRFWDVNSGEICVDNKNVKDYTLNNLRSNVTMLSQDTYLFNETIIDNIQVGKLDATDKELEQAARRASIHDFIISLPKGYYTKVGELGGKISSGERQRIGIARSLIQNKPVIVLDEPTSNLDTLNEKVILKTLDNDPGLKGKTIITVSHRPSTIAGSDEIVVINDGKIVERGTQKSLVEKKGKYCMLIDAENKGLQ
jgi:ATP-binding cassette subfamily C protein